MKPGRLLAFATILVAAAGCTIRDTSREALNAAFTGQAGEWIDLTHAYSADTVYWPTDSLGFQFEELAYGETEAGFFYSAYRFASAEHGGTHLDAPIHFARGMMTADEIPLDNLVGPLAVVDVSTEASADADYRVTISDLQSHEATHGQLPDGVILLVNTGWGERWGNRLAYLGTSRVGAAAIPELHFPGIHPDAAQWLVENRSVGAVGVDTPSIDYGQSSSFESHVILYKQNIPGFENVANVDKLPMRGAYVVALPMKIAGGSGGPLRIVAYVPGDIQ